MPTTLIATRKKADGTIDKTVSMMPETSNEEHKLHRKTSTPVTICAQIRREKQ